MSNDMPPAILCERLCRPFAADEIQWVPLAIAGRRALVAPYVDVRSIEDRLDEVFGVGGWQDHYKLLPGGCMLCRLAVRIDQEWIIKSDVGAPPQDDGPAEPGWVRRWLGGRGKEAPSGRRTKAATTDALKRAAVKLGIGRYLGRCLKVWVEWDPVRREPVQVPALVVPAGTGGTKDKEGTL